jgi:hypothetical protein
MKVKLFGYQLIIEIEAVTDVTTKNMNLTRTTWRPDTCGCEIVYEWDRDLPAEERVHSAVSNTKCKVHESIEDVVDHYESVKDENVTKNRVVNKISELYPAIKPEEIFYEFGEDRKLSITLPESIKDNASHIKSEIDSIIGEERILLN